MTNPRQEFLRVRVSCGSHPSDIYIRIAKLDNPPTLRQQKMPAKDGNLTCSLARVLIYPRMHTQYNCWDYYNHVRSTEHNYCYVYGCTMYLRVVLCTP